ncbi:hypothetical protein J25TS5_56290 [Paenibacillus faecis]|nr:hypothetical protein J25TS5_56290 [Paenibacillus faecis]
MPAEREALALARGLALALAPALARGPLPPGHKGRKAGNRPTVSIRQEAGGPFAAARYPNSIVKGSCLE